MLFSRGNVTCCRSLQAVRSDQSSCEFRCVRKVSRHRTSVVPGASHHKRFLYMFSFFGVKDGIFFPSTARVTLGSLEDIMCLGLETYGCISRSSGPSLVVVHYPPPLTRTDLPCHDPRDARTHRPSQHSTHSSALLSLITAGLRVTLRYISPAPSCLRHLAPPAPTFSMAVASVRHKHVFLL